MKPCSVEDCDKKHHAHGYCSMHASRVRTSGDPHTVGNHYPGRSRLAHPTYGAVHKRLERERGRAAGFGCVDCSNPASEWSYDGGASPEFTGPVRGSMLAYSTDLGAYLPRCKSCHRHVDESLIRDRNEKGQWAPTARNTSED